MMKFFKKLAVVAAALIMACALLSGCGSEKESPKDETKETQTTGETQAEADDDDQKTSSDTGAEKHITVKVIFKDGTEKEYQYTTNAEMLGEVLEDEGLVEGIEGDAGLYVTTVDGEKADDKSQEWWKVSRNGEMTQMGVDNTEIADGDQFELAFTTGYY